MTTISPLAVRAARPALSPAWRGWIKRRWQMAWERLAPLGWEDELGFHYGAPPAPSRSRPRKLGS